MLVMRLSEGDRANKGISAFILTTIISIILGLSSFYKVFWSGLSSLLLDEGYGYLSVALVIVLILIYMSLRESGFSIGFSPLRLLASLLLVDLSLLFYFLSNLYLDYVVQLQGLSLTLLFLSLLLLVFRPVYARDILPLLSLFLLIPPPSGFFDSLTPWLSRSIGSLIAWLSGSGFQSGPGYALLYVSSPAGTVSFEVARACTGIVTMSSVLAVAPVILYLLAYSPRGVLSKLLASLLALTAGIMVGLIGNIIRVLLVVVGTRLWGPGIGLELFHYTPSIIYSALSVWLSFLVAFRIGGLNESLPRIRIGAGPGTIRGIAGVTIVLLMLAGSYASIIEAAGYLSGRGDGSGRSIVAAPSIDGFLADPLDYMNSGFKVLSNVKDEWLTSVLNALDVYRVLLEYNGSVYNGFVEVVDNPGRLHTWQLCLQLQGYTINESHTMDVNGSIINVIYMEKNNRGYVLSYRLIPVDVETADGEVLKMWVRASILSPGGLGEVSKMRDALLSMTPSTREGNIYPGLTRLLSYTAYILITVILIVALRGYRSS